MKETITEMLWHVGEMRTAQHVSGLDIIKLVTCNFPLLLRRATIQVSSFYYLGEVLLFSLVATSD
jgi:hypothetical protein